LMLGGDNTHSGETVIMAGAFQLIKAEASTVAVQTSSSTSTITMDSTAGLQIGQHVTGTNISAGTFISGISGNTITLSRAPTAAVSGSLDFAALNGSLRNSTLNYNNQGGQLSFGTLTTTAELGAIKGAQNLALTNASSNAVALTVGLNGSSTAYSGIFSGAGSLVKDGEGSLTLTNASTFSGGTQVRAGALLIQNSGTASVLGSGSVSTLTNSGAVLGGSGSITGGSAKSITLNAGTFLRIGQTHNTAGIAQKLQLGSSTPANVNISLAGTLQFDLFSSQVGTPEAEADLLKLVSTSSISLNGGTVNVAALGDTSSWIVGDTWQLIDWAGTTQTGGLSLGLMPDLVGRTWTSYSDSNGFYVQLAAIPEPSKMILLLSGTLALGLRRQRSKRSA
jgi:autotransporter-associated beta strand protein